ncbi:MAG: hypothetical protein V4658_15185 [Bacteroidota bacterium]
MDATGCISNETWQDYAAGRLDESGKELLLRHAASCVLCADILEGIGLMEQPALLEQHVKKINEAVSLHTAPRKTIRINTAWYAAAAILLMACGITWYLFTPTVEKPIALRQQPELSAEKPVEEKQETIRSEDVPVDVPQADHAPARSKPAKSLALANGQAISSKRALTDPEQKTEIEQERSSLSVADASIREVAPGSRQDKFSEEAQKQANAETVQDAAEKMPAAKKSRETYPSAYSANNNNAGLYNNLRGARSISHIPDSVVYQSALVHYQAKQYDSCRMVLSDLITDPASACYEDGMLLMAKTYMATGEKTAAKRSLQTVIGLNGKGKKEAETLLKSLK